MKETIGVVVATYNGEKYIEEQLESICKQTHRPDFIVVTDGGSIDHTIDICKSVSTKYEEIKWDFILSAQRLSASQNFEIGIKNCNTDYVFLSDQDDFWYANKIEKFIKVFRSNPKYIVVMSDADVVDSELRKSGRTQWKTIGFVPCTEVLNREALISEMLRRNIFTGMCMAYRNGSFSYDKIKSDYMLHDEAIGWFAIFNGDVGFVNERTAAYRQHSNNTIGSMNYNRFKSINETKKLIKISTEKKRNKIGKLLEIYNDNGYIDLLVEAYSFHNARCEINEQNGLQSLINIIRWIIFRRYNKFCSNTERAAMKDIFSVLTKNREV